MREKLIKLLYDFPVQMEWHSNEELADYLIDSGITIPVQCKDCKHQTTGLCPMENVDVPWAGTKDDDFCSFGERKGKWLN